MSEMDAELDDLELNAGDKIEWTVANEPLDINFLNKEVQKRRRLLLTIALGYFIRCLKCIVTILLAKTFWRKSPVTPIHV